MKEVIVGTAGHIDHGKTALVKALTGTDADRLPEEKARGITVDIGFAEMQLGDSHFGFIDVPGHERFVKNMLAGACGIDVVLLVIAADDGVMPQTREHFEICRLLGVRSGVIAITKCDLVDTDALEIARLDAVELVSGSFLENAPVVSVSSITSDGIEALREALASAATERSKSDLMTRMPIDRSFSMKGFGTVVTGTLASGSVIEGDEIELLPSARRLRIRGLQSHGKTVATAHAGQRVAVNLAGIDHSEITRGMMLAEPDVLRPTQMIDARVEVLAHAKRPVRSRQRVRLHIGTAEVLARVRVLDASHEIAPESAGFVQLSLETSIATVPGERFIIRSYSPQTTIAGGEVIHNSPRRHRVAHLATLTTGLNKLRKASGTTETIMVLITASDKHGVTLDELRALTGLAAQVVNEAADRLISSADIVSADGTFIATSHFADLSFAVTAAVEAFHKRRPLERGMSREELRERIFRGMKASVSNHVIRELIRQKNIVGEGEMLRSSSFGYELSDDDQKQLEGIRSAIVAAGLEVPKIDEVMNFDGQPQQNSRRLLQLLIEGGEIAKVTDEFYFGIRALDDLAARLRHHAEKAPDRSIDVSKFKDLARVSRKYAIPLLEYFDRTKVTVRRGDVRIIL